MFIRCPAPCHQGACLPCPLTATITCACGSTRYSVPCGVEARAAPPQCSLPCKIPRSCRHAGNTQTNRTTGLGYQLFGHMNSFLDLIVLANSIPPTDSIPPHRCHFGPCPSCPFGCGTPLSCGHTCSSTACHDPMPPAVPDYSPPPPPVAPSTELGSKPLAVPVPPAKLLLQEMNGDATQPHTLCQPCTEPIEVGSAASPSAVICFCQSAGGPTACSSLLCLSFSAVL
jgi:hypothetical protein